MERECGEREKMKTVGKEKFRMGQRVWEVGNRKEEGIC